MNGPRYVKIDERQIRNNENIFYYLPVAQMWSLLPEVAELMRYTERNKRRCACVRKEYKIKQLKECNIFFKVFLQELKDKVVNF